jgi:hypothetical protein
MLSSSLCAEVSIDISDVVKSRNTWAINKVYKFSGPPALAKMFPNKIGEIYIQAKYKICLTDYWTKERKRWASWLL